MKTKTKTASTNPNQALNIRRAGRPQTTQYNLHNIPGLKSVTTSQQTGHQYHLLHTEQAGYVSDGGAFPWTVKCITHDCAVSLTTHRIAQSYQSNPGWFCERCKAEHGLANR